MATLPVLEKDIDAILASNILSISGHHAWRKGSHKAWARIDIDVAIRDEKIKGITLKGVTLKMVISLSLLDDRRDFSLLWNNVTVRRLDIAGSHNNRHSDSEKWSGKTHKHAWRDACWDRFAYTPTDITETTTHGILKQFCAECGINCSATIAENPAAKGGLYDDL